MSLFGPRNALITPPAIKGDKDASEIVRAWVAHGDLHVVLRHDAFPDESAWGVALVDLARHIANAYRQASGRDPADVLKRIRMVFDAEWGNQTDEAVGSIVK